MEFKEEIMDEGDLGGLEVEVEFKEEEEDEQEILGLL